MIILEDIIGKKFNHWTVLAFAENKGRDIKVECVCDCGTKRVVSKKNIVSGRSSSCGCSRKQYALSSRMKSADTLGEKLVEKVLLGFGGSLLKMDKKGNPIPGSMDGTFLFEKQARYEDDGNKFIFDFVVYADTMIAIEYDGGFHFKPVMLKEKPLSEFMHRHERDLRKDKYCETMNIPLLRIRYNQEEILEELVKDVLANPTKYVKYHNPLGEKYYEEWEIAFKQMISVK